MEAYEYLRIAIVEQLKIDYLKGCIDDTRLYYELHTEWMKQLIEPADPDKVFKVWHERKLKYGNLSKNKKYISAETESDGKRSKRGKYKKKHISEDF